MFAIGVRTQAGVRNRPWQQQQYPDARSCVQYLGSDTYPVVADLCRDAKPIEEPHLLEDHNVGPTLNIVLQDVRQVKKQHLGTRLADYVRDTVVPHGACSVVFRIVKMSSPGRPSTTGREMLNFVRAATGTAQKGEIPIDTCNPRCSKQCEDALGFRKDRARQSRIDGVS